MPHLGHAFLCDALVGSHIAPGAEYRRVVTAVLDLDRDAIARSASRWRDLSHVDRLEIVSSWSAEQAGRSAAIGHDTPSAVGQGASLSAPTVRFDPDAEASLRSIGCYDELGVVTSAPSEKCVPAAPTSRTGKAPGRAPVADPWQRRSSFRKSGRRTWTGGRQIAARSHEGLRIRSGAPAPVNGCSCEDWAFRAIELVAGGSSAEDKAARGEASVPRPGGSSNCLGSPLRVSVGGCPT